MAIKKQEFYEGAALHVLARGGCILGIRYESPFFVFNDRLAVLLKYSTRNRSPWGFTFAADEQIALRDCAAHLPTSIALICGADGVAAIDYQAYSSIAPLNHSSVHIASYRDHGEHYGFNGPNGSLKRKIAPSSWQRILTHEASRSGNRTTENANSK